MNINVDDVADFYTYFYSKKYKNKKYKLEYTDWSLSIVKKFIKNFELEFQHPDRWMLWCYCVFQFEYRETQNIAPNPINPEGRILLNMIFDEKPFYNFCARDINFDWKFKGSDYLKLYKFNFNDVPERKTVKVNEVYDYEEILKLKFKNDDTVLVSCIEFTTLYKPDSKICIDCNLKER